MEMRINEWMDGTIRMHVVTVTHVHMYHMYRLAVADSRRYEIDCYVRSVLRIRIMLSLANRVLRERIHGVRYDSDTFCLTVNIHYCNVSILQYF